MTKRIGDTLFFDVPPAISGFAAVGGKKEGEGPLAADFDFLVRDTTFGRPTWEQAESRLQQLCVTKALDKCGVPPQEIDLVLAGDLQNQCTASNYTLRELGLPFAGLYSACATMAESLGLAACLVQAGLARRALTPARILVLYVVGGVALSALGWYGPFAAFAGAGATVPLLGFGHLLAQGVENAVDKMGLLGALTGGFSAAAGGIAASLVCGVLAALLAKSRDQC